MANNRFQVFIYFVSGHDCEQAVFEDVPATNEDAAHKWAFEIANQIGIPVSSTLVYPMENRQYAIPYQSDL